MNNDNATNYWVKQKNNLNLTSIAYFAFLKRTKSIPIKMMPRPIKQGTKALCTATSNAKKSG